MISVLCIKINFSFFRFGVFRSIISTIGLSLLSLQTFHGVLTAVAPEDDVTIPVLTPFMPSSAAHLPA